ncbi:MAG: aminotransferase class V-fold PLP-dependent enzyme [SAR202 cluster bacterium]|nr:aminotransferase class V-fold PLP-dependent enzyme [Dehalococcoidia bacterium]MDP7612680.1 aminotransferase class V-fold PLP-dependent enzyme [Dehalococcoidia bacterium]MQG47404.1 aminotransferase class V-fold PLP-dependent enzyme [SAR202 cluster bacterium]
METKYNMLSDLGLEPIIQAGGPTTMYSGTRPRTEVLEAMREMSESFVRMDELLLSAGEKIAEMLGVEAATITSGASGGLVLQAGAAISKGDNVIISKLPDTKGVPCELIIQKSHRFSYDSLYLVPGSKLIEVGEKDGCTVEQIQDSINSQTAGIIHLESPFKGAGCVNLDDLTSIAERNGLPVLVDAASMLPPRSNLTKFTNLGCDLVSFSGGKAVRGPQSTGFLVGKKDWIEYCRILNAPYPTVARAQKVSKEEIAGLLVALELFLKTDEKDEIEFYGSQMKFLVDQIVEIPGIDAKVIHNRDHYIPHAVIEFNSDWNGPTGCRLGELLLEGKPRIYLMHTYPGFDGIWVDPLNLQTGDLEIVSEELRKLLISFS